MKPYDFFIVRHPRLSSAIYKTLNAATSEEEFRTFTENLFADPQLLDAIRLASEDFYRCLVECLSQKDNTKFQKLIPTIYKYVSRMSIRPTPFGKFSAVALGKISSKPTSLIFSGEFITKYRLDYHALLSLNEVKSRENQCSKNHAYHLNNTIFQRNESINYLSYSNKGSDTTYTWSRIKNNPLIAIILEFCSQTKKHIEVTKHLQQYGLKEKDADSFIKTLLDIKILIHDRAPSIIQKSGDDLINEPLTALQTINSVPRVRLSKFINDIQIRDSYLGPDTDNAIEELSKIVDSKNLVHADMSSKMKSSNINRQAITNLITEVLELAEFNNNHIPNDLVEFKKRFTKKYDMQEISLLTALEGEDGIGYGHGSNSLTHDCPILQNLSNELQRKGNSKQASLLDKLAIDIINNLDADTNPISLESLGIIKQPKKKLEQPYGSYVMGNLLYKKHNGLPADDDKIHLNLICASGVSSVPLLARFSHLNKNIHESLSFCATTEEALARNSILAEIIFLPNGKAGNILSRPPLFKYEIPILGRGTTDDEHTIALKDLMVSVRNDKVILRCARTNKFVHPRLSSAHNFHYGMAIYRFLCDLQYQDNGLNIGWHWADQKHRKFLPRITYKKLILSRAIWNITEIPKNEQVINDDDTLQNLISYYNLPDEVFIAKGDNEILINLQNKFGAQILLKELAKEGKVTLIENLYKSYASVLNDVDGSPLHNEVIIPLFSDTIEKNEDKIPKVDINKDVCRKFLPGSEWLYMKVYCGQKESDKLIINLAQNIVRELQEKNVIDKWFFIRYYDPDHHLRIRFHIPAPSANFSIIAGCIYTFFEDLLRSGKISKFSFDTYERELERYGIENIEICESIFYLESDVISAMLDIVKNHNENLRWKIAMVFISILYSAFNIKQDAAIRVFSDIRDKLLKEFSGEKKLKFLLDQTYRKKEEEIKRFFDEIREYRNPLNTLFEQYSDRIHVLANEISIVKGTGDHLSTLVSSLAHMLLNRIFFTKQREHELVTYHLVVKHTKTIVKRSTDRN